MGHKFGEYTLKMDEPYEGRILAPLGGTLARFSLDDAAQDVADMEYGDLQVMLDKANAHDGIAGENLALRALLNRVKGYVPYCHKDPVRGFCSDCDLRTDIFKALALKDA